MISINEGKLNAEGLRIGIALARFNSFITERLLDGAIDALVRHGAARENIDVYKAPGCFEIPLLAQKLSETKRYDAIICLGALIRGATPHFDYIAAESAKGIAQCSLKSGTPISYGIITTDNLEQAIDRAGAKVGNKGAEAAMAAVEMVNVLKLV
ncbi:MAG: 6,7-dimethyl-8-ribityllumazine synthase [Bradymonadales bacterium]|jgi:6,7-dimethyl-8-ribityllumazine synthase